MSLELSAGFSCVWNALLPLGSWDLQNSGATFQESPEQNNPSLTVFLGSLYWLVCVVSVVNSEDRVFPFNRILWRI